MAAEDEAEPGLVAFEVRFWAARDDLAAVIDLARDLHETIGSALYPEDFPPRALDELVDSAAGARRWLERLRRLGDRVRALPRGTRGVQQPLRANEARARTRAALAAAGPVTAAGLAERLGLSRNYTHRLLHELADRGEALVTLRKDHRHGPPARLYRLVHREPGEGPG